MSHYADLEIGLHRRESDDYAVELRFNRPNDDVDHREIGEVLFDFQQLRSMIWNPKKYGQMLSEALFNSKELRDAFIEAVSVVREHQPDWQLRIRLVIGQSAPELHSLRWETLHNPVSGLPICTDENLLFSRYLTSLDWRPIRLRPRGELSALVVVANPTGLASYGLPEIDVANELGRARTGLGIQAITCLPEGDQRASLNQIVAGLRNKSPDIFYLVCHGTMNKGKPYLWLEAEDGSIQRISVGELVNRLRELPERPRLAILVSCQSAGSGDNGAGISSSDALVSLGPRLIEIGVPAVIAMQDFISMETSAEFLPTFFKALYEDGQIDRAMTVARGKVSERSDAHVPVLFMRLKSGRLWYRAGFGGGSSSFEKFPALVNSIRRGRCTPILGPNIVEPILGSPREIARRWAEDFHYPLAPHERESLPQVAQFLAINQSPGFPFDELEETLKNHICENCPEEILPLHRTGSLEGMIQAVGAARRAMQTNEPHKLLAELPIPVFITANQDHLLEDALAEAGKDPQTLLCPWNDCVEQVQTIYDREPSYEPSEKRPIVFHLFGSWKLPDSVVLTEDQYFDFLIGVTSNKDLIPEQVRLALTDTGLLFLGFQTSEWDFRVTFRSLVLQPGSKRRKRYPQIAAQIEPEDGRILEPLRARQYLEQYFAQGAQIDIYWGNPEEFMTELIRFWRQSRQEVR